jgi:predicted site-specific integrase-resolvase
MNYEKLSNYAKRYGVTYRTAWNRYKKGKIEGAIEDIIVINNKDDDKTDLMNDLISIIYSFSARMYGLRKRKNRDEIKAFIEK